MQVKIIRSASLYMAHLPQRGKRRSQTLSCHIRQSFSSASASLTIVSLFDASHVESPAAMLLSERPGPANTGGGAAPATSSRHPVQTETQAVRFLLPSRCLLGWNGGWCGGCLASADHFSRQAVGSTQLFQLRMG